MVRMKPEPDHASAVAAYKSVLKRVVDNRPSGTRHRLAMALRKDITFVSQIANPACSVPLPPVHLETIFEVCHFTPGDKSEFLAAYTQANALEPFGDGELRTTIEHMHKMEHELVRSEERYRALYDDNPSMYFTLTPSGTVLSVNQFGARQLGYAAEELVGRSVLSVFVEADRPAALAHVAECLANPGRVHHWELRKVRKDGTLLWVKETARAVHGSDDQPVVLVVCEDITERKRAEEAEAALNSALEKVAREWELTFECIEAPILILDFRGCIVRLNRAARELLSGGSRELAGRSLEGTAPGEPWRKASELAAEVARTRTPARGHVDDEADGRTWHITADLSPGLADGGERLIVVVRDVTQMVTLQESLRRSESLSAIGSLVAGVAHEVRNPLFAISANLDVFEAELGARTDCAEMIAVLRREAGRLVALMQELLDYGRPAVKTRLPDSLEGAVGDAVAACRELVGKYNVELVNRARGLPPVVMDRNRIVQVFQNLVANAIQHSPTGGQVLIEAQETSLDGQPWVACSVADSGPGLPCEDLRRVFEPFFTRRRGGTGLGLSIAQRIVEDHGGLISAANRPGGGALFTVKLPAAAGTEGAESVRRADRRGAFGRAEGARSWLA